MIKAEDWENDPYYHLMDGPDANAKRNQTIKEGHMDFLNEMDRKYGDKEVEIRLFFEAKPYTDNTYDEFKALTAGAFSEEFEYGGYISMNALEKVFGAFEPVYQMICRNPSNDVIKAVKTTIEPPAGYVVHVYTKKRNQNSKLLRTVQ